MVHPSTIHARPRTEALDGNRDGRKGGADHGREPRNGAAIAREFHAAGARVAITARGADALEALADELGGPDQALALTADISDPAAASDLVGRVAAVFGRLDFAVNNAAGGGHGPTPLADVSPEALDSGLAVTLRGVFLSMRAEIPAMVRCGGGAIVNISSTAGLQAVGGVATYVAGKHGVEGLTKVAALDYAEQRVRVNALAPGPILTDNLRRAGNDAQQAAASAMPLKRIGNPQEVAAAAVWLCSDQAGFITGTTLTIDGGKLAGTPPFHVAGGRQ